MTTPLVIPVSQFDASAVVFSGVNKNQHGGKVVYLNLPGKQKPIFQLPAMKAPFGFSTYQSEDGKSTSFSVSLDLSTCPDVHAKFKALDERAIDYAAENSETLFGKKIAKEVLRDVMYTSPVRKDKNGKYGDTLFCKVLQARDGKSYAVEAYESNRKPADISSLDKLRNVVTIVQIGSMWFMGNKSFGITVRLEQVLFMPKTQLQGFSFVGLEDAAPAEPTEEDEEEYEEEDEDA